MKSISIKYQDPIELRILEQWCRPISYENFTECLVDAVLQQVRLKIHSKILRLPFYAKMKGKLRLSQAEAYALWNRVSYIYKPDTGYEMSLFNREIVQLHKYMLTTEINARYGS